MTLTYKNILAMAKYPTDVLVLDFETFFDKDYNFDKLSTVEYVADPRFEVVGLGCKSGDKESVWNPGPLPQMSAPNSLDSVSVIVQNAKFDILVLKEKFGIVPKYIIDVKDLARHYDARMSHKLADMARMFGIKPKGDTKQFVGLHWHTMAPEQQQAMVEYNRDDLDITFELFKILLPKLTNAETELKIAQHTLDIYLNPKVVFDFKLADELAEAMEDQIDIAILESGLSQEELSGNKTFVAALSAALPEGESVPMKLGKKGNIPALAKDDDGCKYLLAHQSEKVQALMRGRQAVKSWPLHIKRIINLEAQAHASKGLLRVPLNYYGGHTGRASGCESINVQNFGSTGRAGKGTHELISRVKELLCSPPSCNFLIADSAQIEARVLAWIAGEDQLVTGFANGEDVYSTFASRLFGGEVRKPRKDDPDSVKKLLTVRRGFGKDAILGSGYGMGAKKFYSRCLQNSDLRPLFDSGEYTYSFIDSLIKTYRNTYTRIPQFWNLVEKCFKHVVKFKQECVCILSDNTIERRTGWEPNLTKAVLTFWNDNNTVNMQLPSGRVMYYRHCRINSDNELVWHWGHLWGGTITENVVQAIARDLLFFWIFECEKRGIPIVAHTHDEILGVVPKQHAEIQLKIVERIMSTGPRWAKGIPLAVEGFISERYKK